MTNGAASPLTVVMVDHDDSFRARIESWLRADPRFRCVGSFSEGETALMEVVSRSPALAVIDAALPGIKADEVIWRLKKKSPSIKIAAVGGTLDDSAVFDALDAGADGFLDKSVCRTAFLEQIAEVARGGCPLSERARKLVVRKYREGRPKPAVTKPLSSREKEVAELVCLGLKDGAIARNLGISIATARWHEKCLHEKLGVHSRADLQLKLLGIKS